MIFFDVGICLDAAAEDCRVSDQVAVLERVSAGTDTFYRNTATPSSGSNAAEDLSQLFLRLCSRGIRFPRIFTSYSILLDPASMFIV
jgi:hypothetical protein